ncbi:MAG: peptidoglycan-binding domain-containing protein [Pseudomonadota bacterium]
MSLALIVSAALLSAPISFAPPPVPEVWLVAGEIYSREARREAQQALNHFGYDVGTPDGIWGPRTQAAIRQWQTDNGAAPRGDLSRAELGTLLDGYRQAIGFEGVPQNEATRTNVTTDAALPAEVLAVVDDLVSFCGGDRATMIAREGLVLSAEMNGDGRPDYIVNGSEAGCMSVCGAANCSAWVIASNGQGGYVSNAVLGIALQPSTFSCGATGSCEFARPN